MKYKILYHKLKAGSLTKSNNYPPKQLMIVAHPDDELLWGGQMLIDYPYWKVVCITNGSNLFRKNDFIKVMTKLDIEYEIWDYEDSDDGIMSIEWDTITKNKILNDLNRVINEYDFEKIVTHNKDGETGHIHHKLVNELVTKAVKNKNKLFYFNVNNSKDYKMSKEKEDLLNIYTIGSYAIKKWFELSKHESLISYNDITNQKGGEKVYDFIEIGTSNFDTEIEQANDDIIGISVEPIKKYLDDLPNKKNVIKVNSAISDVDEEGTIKLYYIPEDVIRKNNLPDYLIGCNSIGKYHDNHISMNLKEYVEIIDVPVISIPMLFNKFNVKKTKYLKIDTEGHDPIILNSLYKWLEGKTNEYYPDKILFESSWHNTEEEIKNIINKYKLIGYNSKTIDEFNTLLTLDVTQKGGENVNGSIGNAISLNFLNELKKKDKITADFILENEDRLYFLHTLSPLIGKYLRENNKKDVLNLGIKCSNTYDKEMLQNNDVNFYGLDITKFDDFNYPTDWAGMYFYDFTKLVDINKKFDVIIDYGVIGWISLHSNWSINQIETYFQNIKNLLKDDGLYFLKIDYHWESQNRDIILNYINTNFKIDNFYDLGFKKLYQTYEGVHNKELYNCYVLRKKII